MAGSFVVLLGQGWWVLQTPLRRTVLGFCGAQVLEDGGDKKPHGLGKPALMRRTYREK